MGVTADPRRNTTDPPEPPYAVGDFAFTNYQKHDLIWCPICHFDPDREPHRFGPGDRRGEHFLEAHEPSDVGAPLEELTDRLLDPLL